MDLIVRNARPLDAEAQTVDIGIIGDRIVAIEPRLTADTRAIDAGGRLVTPGLVETHIHLDKSRIQHRCHAHRGDLAEAIEQVGIQKKRFTEEDVYDRARVTLENAVMHGTTHMRTHLEVDPGIGLRGFNAIRKLADDYKWAIDLEICIFPQEGMLNNPGTEALMLAALKSGGRVIGAVPYIDSNPHGQIDRVFEIAHDMDIDIDMHLDFTLNPDDPDLLYVCDKADQYKWGGRVAIGHVTNLSAMEPLAFAACAKRMADAGVALSVLPSTDLYLMGRDATHAKPRGVTEAHKLLHLGVNCSLSTNNVLNPFTPFGDCSLVRLANLYANVGHVGSVADTRACLHMITTRSARMLNLKTYGIRVGGPADLVVLDAQSAEQAIAEVAPVLFAIKRGRHTVTRHRPELHRPALVGV